jgi:hypothetical protein
MYKYIVLFISSFIYSQSNILTVTSTFDDGFLGNVLIYSENKFLGQTDLNGQITIYENFKTLKIVKENYDDIEYSSDEIIKFNWKVKLIPIKTIELNEVVISKVKEDPIAILNKIRESRYAQRAKTNSFYQSNILFKCENEILFKFNNILFLSDALKVNNQDNILYKGYRKVGVNKNYFEVFEVSSKECQIPVQSSVYCSLGEYVITPIFEAKLYNYELLVNEDFYVLKFFPKKNNSNLLYEGHFIIDKFDYGIIELNMSLTKSENNVWKTKSYDSKSNYEFKIKEDNFKFKFSKVNNRYFLDSSSRNMNCTQIKGNHIGKDFSFSLYNEETLNHGGLTYKDFDFINNKFK